MMEIGAYSHALVALALYAMIGQVLSAYAAVVRSKAGFGPGEVPAPDYVNPVYRACRTYGNTVDNMGTFAAAVVAAVLTGATPFWINLFAFLALLARLSFVFLYLRGVGKAEGGPRSTAYVFQSAMTILIALFAVVAGFS